MAVSYTTEKLASAIDAWMEHNFLIEFAKTRPFYNYLVEKKRIQMGGINLVAPIAYVGDSTNIGPISDFTANLTRMAASTEKASYAWKYYGGLVLITEDEEDEVRNDQEMVNLLENRLNVAVENWAELIATDLFAKTTTSGHVNAFYPNVVTTGTVGGLTVTGNWASPNPAAITHATDPVGNATISTQLAADYITLEKNGNLPDLIVMSPSVFARFEVEVLANSQWLPQQAGRGQMGFTTYAFRGATIMMEPHMFEDSTSNSGDVKGWYLMFNSKYNYLVCNSAKPKVKPTEIPLGWARGYKSVWGLQNCFYNLRGMLKRVYSIT